MLPRANSVDSHTYLIFQGQVITHACVCACVRAYVCVSVHMHAARCNQASMYARTHVRTYTRMHVCMLVHCRPIYIFSQRDKNTSSNREHEYHVS